MKARRIPDGEVPVHFAVADTLALPFEAQSFDLVSVGFGIRNVEDLEAGLTEMFRVLKPGGRALILEFTRPPWRWFDRLFGFYFHHVLPRIGRWLSSARDPGQDDAYRYLPESVGQFPDAPGLARLLEACGYEKVTFRCLSLGIAAIHVARRPAGAPDAEG